MSEIAQSKHLLADHFLGLIGHAAWWFFCVPWIPKIFPRFLHDFPSPPGAMVPRCLSGAGPAVIAFTSGTSVAESAPSFSWWFWWEKNLGKPGGKHGKPWENNGEMYLKMMKWRFLAKFSSENGMKMDLLHLVLLKLHPGMDLPKSEF